jgi:hypothetical protein
MFSPLSRGFFYELILIGLLTINDLELKKGLFDGSIYQNQPINNINRSAETQFKAL